MGTSSTSRCACRCVCARDTRLLDTSSPCWRRAGFATSRRMRYQVWSGRERPLQRHALAASGMMSPIRSSLATVWSARSTTSISIRTRPPPRHRNPTGRPSSHRIESCAYPRTRRNGQAPTPFLSPACCRATSGVRPRRLLIRVAALTVLLATAAALGAGRLDIQVPGAAHEPVLVAPTATIPADGHSDPGCRKRRSRPARSRRSPSASGGLPTKPPTVTRRPRLKQPRRRPRRRFQRWRRLSRRFRRPHRPRHRGLFRRQRRSRPQRPLPPLRPTLLPLRLPLLGTPRKASPRPPQDNPR